MNWQRLSKQAQPPLFTELKAEDKSARAITRRAFLPLLFISVSLISFGYSVLRPRRTASLPEKRSIFVPRFMAREWKDAKKDNKQFIGRMSVGFYINPKSQIVHFVEAGGRIRCVSKRMNRERLKLVVPSFIRRGERKPRVNRSVAAYSFEQAAISYLKENNTKDACELLLVAISQDLVSTERGVRKDAPSFRIYDLLAGLAVRSEREVYLARMLSMIDRTDDGVKGLFTERVIKWKNKESQWYRKWSQKGLRIGWKLQGTEGWVF